MGKHHPVLGRCGGAGLVIMGFVVVVMVMMLVKNVPRESPHGD